jgi:hypothetical protein
MSGTAAKAKEARIATFKAGVGRKKPKLMRKKGLRKCRLNGSEVL